MWISRRLRASAALLIALGCGPDVGKPGAAHRVLTTASAPVRIASNLPAHIDSVLPREEALGRFQAGSRSRTALEGGASSREALVRRFVAALERSDTAALRRMALTRGEFAYLYYPTAPEGFPPYELSPDLFWFMLSQRSQKGISRALSERGGRPLDYVGHTCHPKPGQQGANRVWGPCLVEHRLPGRGVGSERLFGLILERGGQYKFVGYSNNL